MIDRVLPTTRARHQLLPLQGPQGPREVVNPGRPFHRPVAGVDVIKRDRIHATVLLEPCSYDEIAVWLGLGQVLVRVAFEGDLGSEIQV